MLNQKALSSLLALAVVLGSYKGYLAIFPPKGQEPKQIFPTRIDSLPEQDQQALNGGILVRNDRDLQKLLQDYGS